MLPILDEEFSSKLTASAREALIRSLSRFEERNILFDEYQKLKKDLETSVIKNDYYAFTPSLIALLTLTHNLTLRQIDKPQTFPKGFNLRDDLAALYQDLSTKMVKEDAAEQWGVFINLVHTNSTHYGKQFMYNLIRNTLFDAASQGSQEILKDILKSYYENPRMQDDENFDFIGYDPELGLAGHYDDQFRFTKSSIDKDPIMLSREDIEIAYLKARKVEQVESIKILAAIIDVVQS